MEIWLVILFLSRKKFHAKQICVLSSSMKSGPVVRTFTLEPTSPRPVILTHRLEWVVLTVIRNSSYQNFKDHTNEVFDI